MQIINYKRTTTFLLATIFTYFIFSCSKGQETHEKITPAAERQDLYLPILKDKRIGLVVNQTSMVDSVHLLDFLLAKDVNVAKILAPEHGFRGNADAGEIIKDGKDVKTGVPIISLYGDNKKPSEENLTGLDVLVFDIQDVGTRFYTYISTMHYVMEACAEIDLPLIILDRPNPNGHYVDGPILDEKYKSFVGMHPVPIVHGLTVGELALMINGEKWLKDGIQCDLEIVKVGNYTHSDKYALPVKPSPNLPNMTSIYLYPSLCLFEGTKISVGRGTYFPFQVIGYPDKKFGDFSFTPVSIEGMSKYPKLENQTCYGYDLREKEFMNEIDLSYLVEFYQKWESDDPFFIPFFEKLAGTDELRKQIQSGMTEEQIKTSWKEGLNEFKLMRKKYLLYPDFE